MQDLFKNIIQNSSNLALIGSTNILITLVYMYNRKDTVNLKELSDNSGLSTEEIAGILSILQKKGLVCKSDRLDKSKHPPFLISGYKLNKTAYEKMFNEVNEIINNCLNSPS